MSFIISKSFAIMYISMPAMVLGLPVVYLFTWMNAWKVQRCNLALGQTLFSAFRKPWPPSETTIAGAAILCINASHALEFS